MRCTLVLLIALLAAAVHAHVHYAEKWDAASCGDKIGTVGDFDYYVFQQFWDAESCHSQKGDMCDNPTDYMKTNLVVHGLWPEYETARSGKWWPQCCTTEALDMKVIDEIYEPLSTVWPDALHNSTSFWEHEWGKHGTCTGLDQLNYFESALHVQSLLVTPQLVKSNIGASVDKTALLAAYAKELNQTAACDADNHCFVQLTCSGAYLDTVGTCWTKDTLKPRACTSSTGTGKCPATIKITAWGKSAHQHNSFNARRKLLQPKPKPHHRHH